MNLLAGTDAGLFVGWKLLDGNPTVFAGYGPSGVATFALDIQDGFKITLSWATDIRGHQDGTEQRASTLDRPKQHYDGAAILLGDTRRLSRARMARYAAQGAQFLLALPHEALTLTADAVGAVLAVSSLTYCDWKQIGQRVTVLSADRSASIDGVIQSVSGNQITLDVAPGSIGARGGEVMPAMAVYLEPQQDFNRYAVKADSWTLSARAAIFDFCPPRAALDLQAATGDAAMAGAFLTSRRPGLYGEYAINFANSGTASLNELGFATTVFFHSGTTTLADIATLLDSSDNLKLTGSYNPAAVLTLSDVFTAVLDGTQAAGNLGTGATLTTYAGHPVWDRGVENSGTISEPVNAQTDLLDLGGVPYAVGLADFAAWGRAVAMTGSWFTDDWAWLKLFLVTTRGPQGMFWLPSWRDDLTWVSTGSPSGGTTPLVIRTDDDSDLLAWYPAQRDRLMVKQADSTVTYCQITGTPVDHGDGTMTIVVNASISGSAVTLLSWLEPARFGGDDFEITFSEGSFEMQTMARAFATSDPDVGETA